MRPRNGLKNLKISKSQKSHFFEKSKNVKNIFEKSQNIKILDKSQHLKNICEKSQLKIFLKNLD